MTDFASKLAARQFVVTSELNPPKGHDLAPLVAKAQRLAPLVDAFNLTDSHNARMSLSAVVAGHFLVSEGLEPIVQITSRDRNRIALQSDMLGAAALGIRNLVCMGGDPPHLGDHPEAKGVFDLSTVELIEAATALNRGEDLSGNKCERPTDFHIGAVVNPGADDLTVEIARLEQKVEAGARYFQTQAIYDPASFIEFAERVADLDVALIAGIIPIKSERMARHMNDNVPGIHIPEPMIEEIRSADDPKAVSRRQASAIVREIRTACAGVHIMAIGWEDQIPGIIELSGISG